MYELYPAYKECMMILKWNPLLGTLTIWTTQAVLTHPTDSTLSTNVGMQWCMIQVILKWMPPEVGLKPKH